MTRILSNWEETLALQIRALRLPVPRREFKFDEVRRWRFDFAYPEIKLAIEVDGGTWTQGRHTRGQGYENDAEKCNQAVLQGWQVLRFTGNMIKTGSAAALLEQMLNARSEPHERIAGLRRGHL